VCFSLVKSFEAHQEMIVTSVMINDAKAFDGSVLPDNTNGGQWDQARIRF